MKNQLLKAGGRLKVHCHAIQCFYVDFFAVENCSKEPQGRGSDQRVAGLSPNVFFLPVRSIAIDRRRSISQLPLQSPSFLSDKVGFEIWSRKWKDKFAHQQWWKFHAIQKRLAVLQSSTDRSWGVLFRRSFKTRDLSGVVVYVSLHSTMYTRTIDRQDTCWARFVWNDTRLPLFFPTTEWRKKSLNSVTVHL